MSKPELFSPAWRKNEKQQHSDLDPETGWPEELQMVRNLQKSHDEAGQVKVNWPDVSIVGFTASVKQFFDIAAGTPTLSVLNIFPASSQGEGVAAIFDASRSDGNPGGLVGKLIENASNKQAHIWRCIFSYSNKSVNANVGVSVGLENPNSGFIVKDADTLPSGSTEGTFTALLITLADDLSIPSPEGYILSCETTDTDALLEIGLESITRISNAAYLESIL